MKTVLLTLALTVACMAGSTQEAAFVESARAATAIYQDRAVAIADGYRQIGRDFPAMGEHWINISLLFDGKIDAAHPEILSYIAIAGKPQLLGVAYLLPLLPDESPPDLPVRKELWHDHFRTIAEETELPQHQANGHVAHAPRMAMLHAWIWLDNPAGMFAADNWAIPFLRLGMRPDPAVPESAAKAAALVSGGADYFTASVRAAVPMTAKESAKVDVAFARARGEAETRYRSPQDLTAVWTALWKEVDQALNAKSRSVLQHLPVR
ncbi:MAG: hypothetical protein ABI822_05555 [Bryobacteraceae bacterium]